MKNKAQPAVDQRAIAAAMAMMQQQPATKKAKGKKRQNPKQKNSFFSDLSEFLYGGALIFFGYVLGKML